jgi:hypothetical protein
MPENIKIIDSSRNVVATALVEDVGGHYSGAVELGRMPETLRKMFEEFEAVVNGQTFGLLDDIERRIEQAALFITFGDGSQALATDIQIFPSTASISFKAMRERSAVSTA